MLVEHRGAALGDAHFRAALRHALVEQFGLAAQYVARIDRLEPAQFVDSRRAEARRALALHILDRHPHCHRRGMPAARRQSSEMGLRGRLVGQMEGLGVVFGGELDHFLARYFVATEARFGADHQILEIFEVVAHFPNAPRNGTSSPSSPCPGGSPIRSRSNGATSTLSKVGILPIGLIAGPLAMNSARISGASLS